MVLDKEITYGYIQKYGIFASNIVAKKEADKNRVLLESDNTKRHI